MLFACRVLYNKNMPFIQVYVEPLALSLNQMFTYHSKEILERGIRVKVEFNHKEMVAIVMGECEKPTDFQAKEILEVLDEKPLLNDELFELAEYMSNTYVASKMSCFKTMLPPSLRVQSKTKPIIMEEWFEQGEGKSSLTPKAKELFEKLQSMLPMRSSLFRKQAKTHTKQLLEKDYIRSIKREKQEEIASNYEEDRPPILSEDQKKAIETIRNEENSTFLLHGVTGSGKTEVFLQLAKETIEQGKQVLFLVPEIGLTPLMIQRVKARFQQKIAIYHSQLSASEKYQQYQMVKNKEVQIVVGTRSACFMPFHDLGLILMDEEHDTSYKQDAMPKYHTRDIALFRSAYHHCKLVLASATPSLESYARAYKGLYTLVELKRRIAKSMPKIELVDLREGEVEGGLSKNLLDKIQDRLAKKEQTILLLNRRGYLPVMKCRKCEETILCPDCGIALSYHRSENTLVCHCCGNTYPNTNTCPKCGSHDFYQHGMGTEKLEGSIQAKFPEAKIVRMDADTTRKKNAHQKLLKAFEEEGDILIGTQMVAKGLDFPNVTLVGILQADAGLVRSDYRANETTYEMLEQASGRAGRADKEGEVLIQTFDRSHYVMESVLNHDYRKFFQTEMQYRHLGNYPPFTYMATLIFSHPELSHALLEARKVKDELKELRVLGPIEISMRQKKKRVRLLLKDKSQEHLETTIWALAHRYKSNAVKLEINMHPLMLEE